MRLVTLLLCSSFVFGQSPAPSLGPKTQLPASSSNQKDQNQDLGLLGIGGHGVQTGAVEVLSDTKGVDFGPYLKGILEQVRENWYHLIPESAEVRKGKLAIEFKIAKGGKVAEMRLVASSGCTALDRPAWGSITASNPFPPLPSEFTGPYLALRLRFFYNPDSSGPESSGKDCSGYPVKVDLAASRSKTKSGVTVSVTAPLLGDLDVPLGGSKPVTAIVTGTGGKENTVEWIISGFGCSGASCGEMTKDSYHAPSIMPSSPFVTLTAVSKADSSAKASVTLHIVDSNPSR
jgi:TonB family protein